ncbi:hypothetical protein UA08_00905 [Talaromyces atroroseus]|uniref:Glycerate dehydrogenase n=1 Tax=Talaromyces atroroseus TaxID=1441469 RepID=A0A225ARV6_TALAT|nr:hypothetical protein UA08_00905 [Talaromyces atroroseus]OKL63730.1 hypothetical protein UA08_00905 [Talaromyces atroroseus]
MAPPAAENQHHHLVHLQAGLFNPPHVFTAPPGVTLTQEHHPSTALDQLHARIRNATIIVLSYLRIDAETLSKAVSPNLKFIAITAVGTDTVDLEACRRRGIRVASCPGSNVESVTNHVMALYFAARRNIVRIDRATKDGTWKRTGSMLGDMLEFRDGGLCLTCDEEVVGILGYGTVEETVGKRVAQVSRALGMKVLISGRKGEGHSTDTQRISFDEVLTKSTLLVIAVPRLPETINLISTAEFQKMSYKTVLINVSRGGIVDEAALLQALKDRSIHGAATDVFAVEPASAETSPLLAEDTSGLNLTLSPHVAWCADKTAKNYASMSPMNVMNFLLGSPTNLVV